jgi:hypothetical protein
MEEYDTIFTAVMTSQDQVSAQAMIHPNVLLLSS